MKRLARIATPPLLAVVLHFVGGCGSGPATDPAIAEQRKQARLTAYGPSGSPSSKPNGASPGASPTPSNNPQADARRRAQGGR